MTNEDLLALAFAAIDESETGQDTGAGHVLSDALEDRGETWETYARRMAWMTGIDFLALYRDRVKVIAAVLLCADWWNTAERRGTEWFPYAVRIITIRTPPPSQLRFALGINLHTRSANVVPDDAITREWTVANMPALATVLRALQDRVAGTLVRGQMVDALAAELTQMLRRVWPDLDIIVDALPLTR